jgi:hypothetical protein
MVNVFKIGLSILLFCCLFHLSSSYYQLVSYLALILFTVLAYQEYIEFGNEKTALLYALLAILFQPVFKIGLTREVWMVIDILVGIGLVCSVFKKDTPLNR